MIKIGVIDFYISEWHANNYQKWFDKAAELGFPKCKIEYVWAETEVSPVDGVTTSQWCENHFAKECKTIEELCEKSDAVMILAPDNSEKHIGYARHAFKFGKPVYIDKTFTSSYEEAEEIFALSDKYGTKFFSTSSLRFCTELSDITDAKHVVVSGTVALFHEYIVHQAEIAVKLLKSPAKRLKLDIGGYQRICRIEAEEEKSAVLLYVPKMPYSVTYETGTGESFNKQIRSDFFLELTKDIITFFFSGTLSFDVKESLEVMRIHDAVIKAESCPGEWVKV